MEERQAVNSIEEEQRKFLVKEVISHQAFAEDTCGKGVIDNLRIKTSKGIFSIEEVIEKGSPEDLQNIKDKVSLYLSKRGGFCD
ncbi:hypothetical protein KAI58_01905 [Candidatus Gracilibacteria bacterium]|nr:hypothetical protein [Candidatus Gracilibacteria bacterium]